MAVSVKMNRKKYAEQRLDENTVEFCLITAPVFYIVILRPTLPRWIQLIVMQPALPPQKAATAR